jgi:hypothetical protein
VVFGADGIKNAINAIKDAREEVVQGKEVVQEK